MKIRRQLISCGRVILIINLKENRIAPTLAIKTDKNGVCLGIFIFVTFLIHTLGSIDKDIYFLQ